MARKQKEPQADELKATADRLHAGTVAMRRAPIVEEPYRARSEYGFDIHERSMAGGAFLCGMNPPGKVLEVAAPLDHPARCQGCSGERAKHGPHLRSTVGPVLVRHGS